ncbi:MAG: hypothetical protein QXP82_03570 [Candidatus Aenigmatarchaeota archaeon]
MRQNQLEKKIMKEITEGSLKPKPRWYFLIPDIVLKVFVGVISLLGGFALATIYFILTDHDWDVFSYLDHTQLEYIIKTIPYFWIISFILLTTVSYFFFRKTRQGYRYQTMEIAAWSLIVSISVGILLVGLGYDHILHNRLLEDVPLYKQLVYTKHDVWKFPEKGLLSGKIESVENEALFYLRDKDNQLWGILIPDDITIERGAEIVPGAQVKLIGEMLDKSEFQAAIIRPWGR